MMEVFRMYKEGMSPDDIRKTTGLKKTAVSVYISKFRRAYDHTECDVCHRMIRGRAFYFRGKNMHGECLIEHGTSLGESVVGVDHNPVFSRSESVFEF